MADTPLPSAIRTWMQDHHWGEHHLRWHAQRQWDRLTPAVQAQLASMGWSRSSPQEGEAGNGHEFLLMHRAMIQILRAEFPANAALFLGWATPPTNPNDPNDPIPANSPIPGPFSGSMQQAIDRLTNNLASFATEDELGLYIETRFRPTAGNPSHLSPDATTGLHNYMHGRFTDDASPINMGDPSLNLDNTCFWRLHGWIDARWSAFRQLKNLSDTDAAYLAALQSEKDAMLGGHDHHHLAPLMMAAKTSTRRAAVNGLSAEVRRPFRESVAARVQRLMSSQPSINNRDELIEYLQTAIQVEHATLPLYLTAMWSLRDDSSKQYEILRSVAMQEMLHFGIVCNLLNAIGADPHIIPPYATLPIFPGQLPGLDLSDVVTGDISLEPFSSSQTDPKKRIKLFMRIEEPEGGDIDPTQLNATEATFTVPKFHSIGEFYDVIIAGVEKLSASGALMFAPNGQVHTFPEMKSITDAAQAVQQLKLIKEQGEGTESSQASGANAEELAHYYRFKQIVEEKEYSWASGKPVLDPNLPLPFPTPAMVRQFTPAPLEGHPQSSAFDQAYSRMLDKLHAAWHGSPNSMGAAKGFMYAMSSEAITLMDSGYGPNFHYVAAPLNVIAEPSTTMMMHRRGAGLMAAAQLEAAPPLLSAPLTPGYARIRDILDAAVNGETFGAHGPFWRTLTRDQFVAKSIFGRPLIHKNPNGTFDAQESNLVKALEGRAPFGKDMVPPPAGALWNRMPDGYAVVPSTNIDEIRAWISAGCPDVAPGAVSIIDSTSPAGLTNNDYVQFWRAFDNVAMYEATEQVQADIGAFFNAVDKWFAFAKDSTKEPEWISAIAGPEITNSVFRIEQLQRETVLQSFGTPAKLQDLLNCWERFGDDTLPDDPLRPVDPRHTMNGETMWFFWGAFADAAIRFSAANSAIPNDFWFAMSRAILIGVLNDGVFRGRFPVQGFEATAAGKLAIRTRVNTLPDSALGSDIRMRFVDGGFPS